jgi:hypothetical protein
MQQHVFSEQEVAEIIQRAAELTEEGHQAGGYTPGITRDELRRIALEVGVSPEALDHAIQERLANVPSERRSGFRFVEEFERVLDGELSPENFDVILENVKPLSNIGQPHAAQIGRTLRASAWTGVSQATIEVSARNGRTKLKVRSNAFFAALMSLYPAVMGSVISGGALGEAGLGWAASAAVGAFLAAGAFAFFRLVKAGHRRAGELANRIAAVISEQTPRDSEPGNHSTHSGGNAVS